MNKKDYIKIADTLREIIKGLDFTTSQTYIQIKVIEPFCDMLEADNPKFNRDTFINYINNY